MFNCKIALDQNIDDFIFIPYTIEKSQYLIVTDSEVDTILNCKKRVNKYNLFNTYIIIKRYVNYETGLSYPSLLTIMDIADIASNNTVLQYIKILEELNLIACARSGYITTNTGIKKANNTYRIID